MNYFPEKLLLTLLFSLVLLITSAQTKTPWNGKKCAVVITYDDAINQHLDNAVPVLDSLGLKATFYLTAFSTSMQNRLEEWRQLAAHGHELGNHTLYHPCIGGPGREWVKPEGDLSKYTVQRMVNETLMTNVFLQALDGKTKRTFAYTCGDTKIGDSSYIESMKDDFVAARGTQAQMHTIDKVDSYNVDCYVVNGETASQMLAWVDKAVQTNSLLVLLFHGVGGGNGLNVSIAEHRKFLQQLKKREKDIWIAPMLPVAQYIKHYQATHK